MRLKRDPEVEIRWFGLSFRVVTLPAIMAVAIVTLAYLMVDNWEIIVG